MWKLEESNDKKDVEDGETKETTTIPALLLPFFRLKGHVLEIEEGTYKATFNIDACAMKKVLEDKDHDDDQADKKEMEKLIVSCLCWHFCCIWA